MKAWVVKDYKEIHMANCLIAIAHKKPEGDFQCTEVNVLTNPELEQLKEQVAREAWEAARTVVEGESYAFEWENLEDYYQQKNQGKR